jgi:spore germination cell wall hydrolase CwlJ-like protein
VNLAATMLAAFIHMTPAAPSQTLDRACLSVVAYTEARSEGVAGMAAVMDVVRNRLRDPRYPKTVCGVTNQHDQFLGIQHWHGPIDATSWRSAQAIADIALSGAELVPPPCRGAVFFSASKPNANTACRIGAHSFRR